MVRTAQRDGLWDVVLPVTAADVASRDCARLPGLPSLHAPAVLAAIVDAALVDRL